jgi:hypothetical protein
VQDFVCCEVRILVGQQEFFFGLKMTDRVLYQLIQKRPDRLMLHSALHGYVQLVKKLDDLPVLSVERRVTDGIIVLPSDVRRSPGKRGSHLFALRPGLVFLNKSRSSTPVVSALAGVVAFDHRTRKQEGSRSRGS